MKDWLPKCCEALVVMKMKDAIMKAGNKYQIGSIPNHRVEDHLVAVKALIERSVIFFLFRFREPSGSHEHTAHFKNTKKV